MPGDRTKGTRMSADWNQRGFYQFRFQKISAAVFRSGASLGLNRPQANRSGAQNTGYNELANFIDLGGGALRQKLEPGVQFVARDTRVLPKANGETWIMVPKTNWV